MEFGARLRELRLESGATLADVAEATGISVPMLSRMENGQRLPSPRFAEALADYFSLPVEDLLADVVSDSIRSRYGMEPGSYRDRMDDERWEPARRRIRAISEQLRREAPDFVARAEAEQAERTRFEQASHDVPLMGHRLVPPASGIRDEAPGFLEDERAAAHAVDDERPLHAQRPISALFPGLTPGSASGDAALAQRASLRHLRESLRSGDPRAAVRALHEAADLAEDPLALLREAESSDDPHVRETARRLLDRLAR